MLLISILKCNCANQKYTNIKQSKMTFLAVTSFGKNLDVDYMFNLNTYLLEEIFLNSTCTGNILNFLSQILCSCTVYFYK